jgi:endogenous inhibitor of DNA gyrase (YacG/DUF329 family)
MTTRVDRPLTCPICGKPAAEPTRLHPFCSTRCADVDLGRWLTGQYRVPGPAPEDQPDDQPTEERIALPRLDHPGRMG